MIALALGLGGCATDIPTTTSPDRSDDRPAARAQRLPALCRPDVHDTITGHVQAPAASELSGLVASRTRRGVLWTHNDSGDGPRLLAIDARGQLLADVAVSRAQAVDWEDIAARGATLYVGDIGDNAKTRSTITVYAVREPAAGATVSAPATATVLRYPDGAHDAEALLVDPGTGALVVVTKEFSGRSGVYTAKPGPGVVTLRRTGRLALGLGLLVTAGDVSADGRTVALRTYDRALIFARRRGQRLTNVLAGEPCAMPVGLASEGQGESLALSASGAVMYTVPEGERPAVRRYR
jgi:hypothetical protein